MLQHHSSSASRAFGGGSLDVRGPGGISLSDLGLVGQLFAGVTSKSGLSTYKKNEFFLIHPKIFNGWYKISSKYSCNILQYTTDKIGSYLEYLYYLYLNFILTSRM